MGALCCRPEAIDFEGEVNLFHFFLLRSVGKGAFGKVSSYLSTPSVRVCIRRTLTTRNAGAGSTAQAIEAAICPQIYQQAEMRKDEGCSEYRAGAAVTRGGVSSIREKSPVPQRLITCGGWMD